MKIVIVQVNATLKNLNVVEVAQTLVLMSLQTKKTGFVLLFFFYYLQLEAAVI